MNKSWERHIETIFTEALDLPEALRDDYLNRACAGDAELKREITSLLNQHNQHNTASLHHAAGLSLISGSIETLPMELGRYRMEERIGEGSFGVVYRATQHTPVKRPVAIKVLRPGYDSSQVIARFNSERQALARMDHPNIAKILDGGSTDSGQPYFVMEYVPGVSITRFADERKLPIEDRLGLFTQVCDAIAHAHAKAIIHRDIKASNVLAYIQDNKPAIKVIDFGIAKALASDSFDDKTCGTVQRADRHLRLHEPGTGHRQPGHRHAHGCLFAGNSALRVARRRQAV